MQHPPPTYYEVDGAAIRKLRKRKGVEISDLAAEVGITPSYLSRTEVGTRRRMRAATFASLRAALGVEPEHEDQLLLTEDPLPPLAEGPTETR